MASKNLYVGNLSFSTTQADLEQLFGQYGTVTKAQVISDRETGRSRGFGFVEMSSGTDEAIAALHDTEFQGRRLTVNEAKPREERPRGGGGGYGGGGGGGVAAAAGAATAAVVEGAAATAAGTAAAGAAATGTERHPRTVETNPAADPTNRAGRTRSRLASPPAWGTMVSLAPAVLSWLASCPIPISTRRTSGASSTGGRTATATPRTNSYSPPGNGWRSWPAA